MLGVLGYAVVRRTREIGIRVALGARPVSVVRLVVRQALTLAAIGVAIGVVLSIVARRALASFLFEISPHDPVTFVAAGALLLSLTLAASYAPARHAVRIDPLDALRNE
jgi:ABC-type antimicrobial peptide transport system permease subunit